jgi:hypothetical protein
MHFMSNLPQKSFSSARSLSLTLSPSPQKMGKASNAVERACSACACSTDSQMKMVIVGKICFKWHWVTNEEIYWSCCV